MHKSVIVFDGPVGVGKTSLGRAVAHRLRFGFLDGDDFAEPGQWLRSGRRTAHKIVAAAEDVLRASNGVIVSYPLRCTNWIFYKATFARKGVDFHSVGLSADLSSIVGRTRRLSDAEVARSREMIAQGYGQRAFHAVCARTDQAGFDETCERLVADVVATTARRG